MTKPAARQSRPVRPGEIALVPFGSLEPSPYNARAAQDDTGIADLAETIRKHGLLVPLQVHVIANGTKGGETYGVLDGERRRRALALNETSADHPVAVCICEADTAKSIVVNEYRQQMSMRDRALAVRKLEENGHIPETISDMLCLPMRTTRQLLRLATLPAPIFEAYSSGSIDLEIAKAFGDLSDGRALEIYEKLTSEDRHISAWAIRSEANKDRVPAEGRVVKFLGVDRVRDELGGIETDLFGDRAWLGDPGKVEAALAAELEKNAETYRAEGWHEVDVHLEGGYTPLPTHYLLPGKPPETAIADLEGFIAKHGDDPEAMPEGLEEVFDRLTAAAERGAIFNPKQRRVGYLRLEIDFDGGIDLSACVHPKKIKEAVELGLISKPTKSSASAADASAEADGWSQTAIARLRTIGQVAAARELAERPEMALTLIAYALQRDYYSDVIGISAERFRVPEGATEYGALQRLEAPEIGVNLAAIAALSKKERNALLARCAAACLKDGAEVRKFVAPDIRKHWRPDAIWLGSLKKDQLIEIAAEIGMGQGFMDFGGAKKGEIVEVLACAFAGALGNTFTEERVKPVYELADKWLPGPLRVGDEG